MCCVELHYPAYCVNFAVSNSDKFRVGRAVFAYRVVISKGAVIKLRKPIRFIWLH